MMTKIDNELVVHAIQAEVTLSFGNDGEGRPCVYLEDAGFSIDRSFAEDFMQYLDAADYELLTSGQEDEDITVCYYFEKISSDTTEEDE